jgi:hypothetical protein
MPPFPPAKQFASTHIVQPPPPIALTLYGTDNSSVTLTDGDLTPSATGTWQTQCTSSITGGTYAANGYITLDFKLTAPATSGDVRISDLYLDYLSKW